MDISICSALLLSMPPFVLRGSVVALPYDAVADESSGVRLGQNPPVRATLTSTVRGLSQRTTTCFIGFNSMFIPDLASDLF